MPSVALHNLGCSKNQIDGERILHLFTSAGYDIVADFSAADVIVVNTCAFIREAQEEAIDAILQTVPHKTGGRCTRLIVSGCFSQRYRSHVKKKFPEVDLWVGVNDWEKLLRTELSATAPSTFKRELARPLATQHLKIAEGCSHGCTYCAIPHIRGKFRSRPVAGIIAEAKWLETQGVRELIIVAQDSSFYGKDIGTNLTDLLEKLLAATSFPWIRTMYLHPAYVNDSLLALFASEKRLCPYFDMPLQHIADPILRAMNRRPLSREIRALVEKIRTTVPDAALRSTFILGFPGETGAHFRELVQFIEATRFDKLGVFPFSPEESTRAFSMRPRPHNTTVMRRCDEIMEIQREISGQILASKVGKVLEVIVDGKSDEPGFELAGRTRNDAPEIDGRVLLTAGRPGIGSLVKVKITGASDYDLVGKVSGN
jgi:ribosomal protein S12 methylthiotransferase